MAEKILQTRILNKIDTHENWLKVADTFVPKNGEICIDTITTTVDGAVVAPPQTLIKIGDGTSTWGDLNFLGAIAADVYAWAKAATKPSYQASEIQGLDDYIAGEIQDTDTQYQIVKDGDMGIKLQSRPKTGGAWSDVGATITLTPPTYELVEGDTNGTVKFNGTNVPVHGLGSAAYTESSAYDAAGAASAVQTALTGTAEDPSSASTINGAKKYAEEKASAAQTAAQGYADSAVATAKTELIGEGDATSTTIKGAVNEAKTYTDTTIAAKIGSAYKAAGSSAFADLPTPAAGIEGNVYNVTDAFTADTKFITAEQGQKYPAGTNVVVVEVPGVEEAPSTYAYDVLTGVTDLSAYSTTQQMNTAITSAVNTAKADLIGTSSSGATSSTIKGAVDEAKTYADGLNSALSGRVDTAESDIDALQALVGETAVATQITNAIGALETDDTAVANQFVTAVDLGADGLTVSRAALTADAIPTITSAKISDFNTAADARVTAGINTAIADGGAIDAAVDGLISTAIAGVAGTATAEGSAVLKSVTLANGVLTGTSGTLGVSDITGLQTALDAKANDSALATIAKTGNVNDLVQTGTDVIVLQCGSSTVNV